MWKFLTWPSPSELTRVFRSELILPASPPSCVCASVYWSVCSLRMHRAVPSVRHAVPSVWNTHSAFPFPLCFRCYFLCDIFFFAHWPRLHLVNFNLTVVSPYYDSWSILNVSTTELVIFTYYIRTACLWNLVTCDLWAFSHTMFLLDFWSSHLKSFEGFGSLLAHVS